VRKLRLRRIFWIGAAAILVAAATVALVGVLGGDFSDTDAQILVTLAALLYTGAAALAGLALVDRGSARPLGWLVAAASPVCLAIMLWGIWDFVDEGSNGIRLKLAWSAVLAILTGLIATTGFLLASRPALLRLAGASGGLAALAAVLSIAGIWSGNSSDAFVKTLAALWILAVLAFLLVPVLQRFSSAAQDAAPRVLGELDGIELVATRGRLEGISVEPPAPGERLALRRTAR
jgi:hypothetical protein